MRYREALRFLYALELRGVRLGLLPMKRALALSGHPERTLRFVHVAGTNGKGSVAAMIEAALREGGFRTGLYTSPHVHRFAERIRINGRPIFDQEIEHHVTSLKRLLTGRGAPRLTFFEATTWVALEAFRSHRPDVVVLETGLGGRLDATNVVSPEVSVITSVGMDHEALLGHTLVSIAREKAGIIKRGVPVVVGARQRNVRAVILRKARASSAQALLIDRDFRAQPSGLALPGVHQLDNAACARAALGLLSDRGFAVSNATTRRAFAAVRWPGRLENVAGRPPVLLDAAHNPDGCKALASYLRALRRPGKRVLLFGAMTDKNTRAMLKALDGVVDARVYTSTGMTRSEAPSTLASIRPGECTESVRDALRLARRLAGPRGLVVVAGSIFVMAEARRWLLRPRTDPLIAL